MKGAEADYQQQILTPLPAGPREDLVESVETEAVNIGGFSIDTGLAWYYEVSVVVSVVLLVYAAKKSIDYFFVKKTKDLEQDDEEDESEEDTEPGAGYDPEYTTVFMKKSDADDEIQKIMKKRKK